MKGYFPAREKEAFIERIVEEICRKNGVGAGELRWGGQRQAVSQVRGKVGWILSQEYRISLAEIARRVGVCTLAIGKAIRKKEGGRLKVLFFHYVPQSVNTKEWKSIAESMRIEFEGGLYPIKCQGLTLSLLERTTIYFSKRNDPALGHETIYNQ